MNPARELIEGIRRAFESGDFAALPALVAPDAEIRNPFTTVRGPEGFAELGRGFARACSEREIEILDVVESGAVAVAELRVRARHTGPLDTPGGTAPATGAQIEFDEADVIHVQDGRIASWHSYYDGLAFARQLGLAPD